MHPHLSKTLQPDCAQVIDALRLCHEKHWFKKFLGQCNPEALAVDECLHQDVSKDVFLAYSYLSCST